MAEDQTSTPAQGEQNPLVVNLQVVSPSVGVNQPLNFPGLPPTTTVRELKAKIRDALPLRPIDDHQRLIHRGRLLSRESDTLEDVFGPELLRNTDQQSLHLVLRDSPDHQPHPLQPAPHPAPNRGQSPAPGNHPAQNHPMHHFRHVPRHIPPNFAQFPVAPIPDPQLAALNHQQQIQQQLQQHQTMMQWMNQLQREGRHSPAPAQPGTVTREMIGPNGQYIRMTFNTNGGVPVVGSSSSNSPQPGNAPTSAPRGQFSPADVHNMLGRHDAAQATQTMTDAMHRSASGTSLANMATNLNGPIQPVPPGVTTPMFPGLSRHASRTATPEPPVGRAQGHFGGSALGGLAPQPLAGPRAQNPARQPSQAPDVYILSSPTGPRGLLVSGSDIYVTPAGSTASPAIPARNPRQPLFMATPPPAGQARPTPTAPAQQRQQLAPAIPQAQGQQHQIQPQVQPHQGHPIAVRRAPRVAHPNNPGAGAMVAAAWPHIWLVIRLAAFVWWFTSADSSWTRWVTIITIATIVFIVNTGMLNGVAGQAWEPIRRHLEGLLPLADPNRPHPAPAAPAPGAPQAANEGRDGRQQNLDPAETAARLVGEHRNANANWLLNQVRRAERAGLLFLASIAPGVAERHIAHLEAQERAERQRREEAEAAAAAAAAEAAATAAAAAEGASNSEETQEGTSPDPGAPTSGGDGGQNEHRRRLIDV